MTLSIFDLPHILEQISSSLSRRDIAHCARVSFSWSQVLAPLTWSDFELGSTDYARLLAQPTSMENFTKHVATIEILNIRYSSTIWPLLEYLEQSPGLFSDKLTRLVMECEYETHSRNATEMLARFLILTKDHVQHLHATIHSMPSQGNSETRRLSTALISLHNLRTMVFMGQGVVTTATLALLLRNCPESLESLWIDYVLQASYDRVNLQNVNDFFTHPENLHQHWLNAPPTNIRTLRLPDSLRRTEVATIIPFLRLRCPKLTTWKHVPLMRPSLGAQIAETLNLHCQQIESLHFHNITPEMLSLYSRIIRACHTLKSISITGKVHDAKDIVQAVTQFHSRSMTRIRWTGGGGFHGGMDLERFLESCSALERLETTYDGNATNFYAGQGAEGAMWIKDEPLPDFSDARGSLPSPLFFWACYATLTHLDARFYPHRNVLNEDRFKKQIEHTYRKLGQLESLVDLRVGCHCRCQGPKLIDCLHFKYDAMNGASEIMDHGQFSGDPLAATSDAAILDMSLNSGLGHLAGLKRLQFLCIAKIQGHKIGYPELEWMKANWPRLRGLRGTRNTRIMEWSREHWPGVQVSYLSALS